MRPLRLAPLLLALPLACGDDERMPVGETPPPPAATGSSTGPEPTPADSTTGAAVCACGPDRFCAAEFELGGSEPLPQDFACRDECLPPSAPGFWCFDDASCCSGACRPDGLCEAVAEPTGDGTTTSTTGTETGTSTGTGTGTGTSTGTGTGTETSTGSTSSG